ncbi:MAG: hypothetical protein ACOZB0_09855 [Pseudomonadota bacterium]
MPTRLHRSRQFLLLTTACLTLSTTPTQAAFIGSACSTDPMVLTMTSTMLALSQDIGTMADRILVTEDKIGAMADRIGVMADRIVATEQLLAETLVELQGQHAARQHSPLILSPATGDTVYRAMAPRLQLFNDSESFVLHVADRADLTSPRMMPILVTPQNPLAGQWPALMAEFAEDTVYMAVRGVSETAALTDLSNWVRVHLR